MPKCSITRHDEKLSIEFSFFKVERGKKRFLFDFLRMFLVKRKPMRWGMLFATAGTRMAIDKTAVSLQYPTTLLELY
ncbi:MAG: hypothetical protein FVQ77_04360 [Cytophagales bacterium]|nr:hypothetical protein [Cytophagales bacterium]